MKRAKTAEEVMAKLQADPKFRQRQTERAEKRKIAQERYAREARPVWDEIRNLGHEVDGLDDLVKRHSPLPSDVTQVLTKWIERVSDARLLEMLVRALGASREQVDGRVLA